MTPSACYGTPHSFSAFLNPFLTFLILISNFIKFSPINSSTNHLLSNFLFFLNLPAFVSIYPLNPPSNVGCFRFEDPNWFAIAGWLNCYRLLILVLSINYHLFGIVRVPHLNSFE